MSQLLINTYLADLDRLKKMSGSKRESVMREAFKDLLKAWGKSLDLQFIPEHEYITSSKERRYIDGALLQSLRVPFGYWEAKDTKDDLEREIVKKFKRGYPQTNIIFEDSTKAILIQNSKELIRCDVDDVSELGKLLALFFNYQRPEVTGFRRAVEQFKSDLPNVLGELRAQISNAYTTNANFAKRAAEFLGQARKAINPVISGQDIREMLIQHILTEDIFARVFGESDFHRENNIAKSLYDLEQLFFRGSVKQRTLHVLEPYYAAIRSTAALIESHSEKQGFLKAIYENFYKVYNEKAADRLGVVYTPSEIVRFMISSADWLYETHFKRSLIDENVEILDPATGTGTFVVEVLEHFRGRAAALKQKYLNELHANEVAILPYYVANLNIEATYAAITGDHLPFPNLCFVDTLDNTHALKVRAGQQYGDLLGGISTENVERIKRQNERKISVIIGNPPYNANQQNENDENKNRKYPEIDRRIRSTYVKESTATRTNVYDMYSRFFRWATDRIDDDGIVAFITNRGYLDQRSFDGFRKLLAEDFNDIYVVDLGGDVRSNPRLAGTTHNVFGIQTGVAITFLVRRRKAVGCKIHYCRRPEFELREDKLMFLANTKLSDVVTEPLRPDTQNNWLNNKVSDFASFIPLVTKETKAAKGQQADNAIFKRSTMGVVTNRDDWVYASTNKEVATKIRHLIKVYNDEVRAQNAAKKTQHASDISPGSKIKWTRLVKRLLKRGVKMEYSGELIATCTYRPYNSLQLYYSKQLNEMHYKLAEFYHLDGKHRTPTIVWSDPTSQKPFTCIGVTGLFDLHLVGAASGAVGAGRTYATPTGFVDNITDWALLRFQEHYGLGLVTTKNVIFSYVYAVLHDPTYRSSYVQDLKRSQPRIPFYANFEQWQEWGTQLFALHTGFSALEPFGFTRTDTPDKRANAAKQSPRPALRSDRKAGTVVVDSVTTLSRIPSEAWDYTLAGRSAIDWVLDQHRESAPKDPVVRALFNTYRLADHKEAMIDTLGRVVTVSVKTSQIISEMRLLALPAEKNSSAVEPPAAALKKKMRVKRKAKA